MARDVSAEIQRNFMQLLQTFLMLQGKQAEVGAYKERTAAQERTGTRSAEAQEEVARMETNNRRLLAARHETRNSLREAIRRTEYLVDAHTAMGMAIQDPNRRLEVTEHIARLHEYLNALENASLQTAIHGIGNAVTAKTLQENAALVEEAKANLEGAKKRMVGGSAAGTRIASSVLDAVREQRVGKPKEGFEYYTDKNGDIRMRESAVGAIGGDLIHNITGLSTIYGTMAVSSHDLTNDLRKFLREPGAQFTAMTAGNGKLSRDAMVYGELLKAAASDSFVEDDIDFMEKMSKNKGRYGAAIYRESMRKTVELLGQAIEEGQAAEKGDEAFLSVDQLYDVREAQELFASAHRILSLQYEQSRLPEQLNARVQALKTIFDGDPKSGHPLNISAMRASLLHGMSDPDTRTEMLQALDKRFPNEGWNTNGPLSLEFLAQVDKRLDAAIDEIPDGHLRRIYQSIREVRNAKYEAEGTRIMETHADIFRKREMLRGKYGAMMNMFGQAKRLRKQLEAMQNLDPEMRTPAIRALIADMEGMQSHILTLLDQPENATNEQLSAGTRDIMDKMAELGTRKISPFIEDMRKMAEKVNEESKGKARAAIAAEIGRAATPMGAPVGAPQPAQQQPMQGPQQQVSAAPWPPPPPGDSRESSKEKKPLETTISRKGGSADEHEELLEMKPFPNRWR